MKMRLALASGVFLAPLLGVACSSGDGPASTPIVEPRPAGAAVQEADFISLFNAINIQLLEDTRVMNQISLSASIDEQALVDSEEATRLVLENLNGELRLVQMLEPVPTSLAGAQESLKTALMTYIQAASLLLPPEEAGSGFFDFFQYQELVQEAGENFHGAGSALPTNPE
jgi:hypothetical protein